MTDALAPLRVAVGRAADLWAPGGCTEVPDGWRAFSHADAVDYNVACGWGEAAARDGMDAVLAAGVKGIVMLAGDATERDEALREASWRAIGDQPLMTRRLVAPVAAVGVELIDAGTLAEARELVVMGFGVTDELAAVALPESAVANPDRFVVGLRDGGALACVVAGVVAGEHLVGWSMATDPDRLRRGHGRRTFEGMLAHGALAGATTAVHIASPSGEGLYRALGFEVRERWAMWSRPRWAFGRA